MNYDKENPSSICSLFDSIAGRYDFGNAALSLQLHRLWNRSLAKTLSKSKPKAILDLCCGTGEIARRLMQTLPQSHFCLVDFSSVMLKLAKKRVVHPNTRFIQADVEELPLEDSKFDAASIAYGIRNVKDRKKCFSELYRVLESGALVGIAELTRPKSGLFYALHKLYLKTFVPIIGKAITQNAEAYRYLCNSIEAFVEPELIAQELLSAGFCNVRLEPKTFGIATLFYAQKP